MASIGRTVTTLKLFPSISWIEMEELMIHLLWIFHSASALLLCIYSFKAIIIGDFTTKVNSSMLSILYFYILKTAIKINIRTVLNQAYKDINQILREQKHHSKNMLGFRLIKFGVISALLKNGMVSDLRSIGMSSKR